MSYKHNQALTENARALRKNMTKQERRVWYDFLRNYPVRFLRQKVIDDYIVDFYCASAGLAIELDGSQHYNEFNIRSDRIRTERIEKRGITVIRIPNSEIDQNFRYVCDYIDDLVQKLKGERNPPVSPAADSPL